jgi:hypothetical protein
MTVGYRRATEATGGIDARIITDKEFTDWLKEKFEVFRMRNDAARVTGQLSQQERLLYMEMKGRMPRITWDELDRFHTASKDKVLKNMTTFEEKNLDPYEFLGTLKGNTDFVKENLEKLAGRKLKLKDFAGVLPRNPAFVDMDLRALDERGIDPNKFGAKNRIGIGKGSFEEILDSIKVKKLDCYSINDREVCDDIIMDRYPEYKDVLRKMLGEMEKKVDGWMSKEEVWGIFKEFYRKDYPGHDMDDYSYDPPIHALHDKMNDILNYFGKNDGLKVEKRSVEKKRYG